MKRLLAAASAFLVTLAPCVCSTFAAAPTFDSASDIEYGPTDSTPEAGVSPGFWAPDGTDNGGFGFLPWVGAAGEAGSVFVASSTSNGDGDNGNPGDSDIDTFNSFIPGPVSWGMYSKPGFLVEMTRPFAGGPLLPGETFSIDLDFGCGPGRVGLTLQTQGGATAFEFGSWLGRSSGYYFIDGIAMGPYPTWIGVGDEGLTLTLTLTGPLNYVAFVTPKGSAPIEIGFGLLNAPGIVQARVFSYDDLGDPRWALFANNMSITAIPEPTTVEFVGLGLVSVLVIRLRRV
jgi:hypothetical protein